MGFDWGYYSFAAGFFGVPEYLSEVNIEIVIEASGYNNSGAPYEVCTNANVASKGSIGSTVATAWSNYAFNSTISRIQSQIKGINVTGSTIISMLQLCSYETDALGYSSFCKLFTAQDFANYEYYYDLSCESQKPTLFSSHAHAMMSSLTPALSMLLSLLQQRIRISRLRRSR